MGWGNCGTDSEGRPIGYNFEATCDELGCDKKIHRGLAYACGDMHGADEYSCEGYFCEDHLFFTDVDINGLDENGNGEGEFKSRLLCKECADGVEEHLLEVFGLETLERVEKEVYEKLLEKILKETDADSCSCWTSALVGFVDAVRIRTRDIGS